MHLTSARNKMTNILLNILEKTTNFTSQTYKALINNAYNENEM